MSLGFAFGGVVLAPVPRCLHPRLLAWMTVPEAFEAGLFSPSTLAQADPTGAVGFRADHAPKKSSGLFCPDCRYGHPRLTGAQELDLHMAALTLFGLGALLRAATITSS